MAVNKNFVVKNGIEVGTRVIVADAQNTHVGLGTTAPLTTLDVRGDVRFADDGATVNTVDIAGETTINKDLKVGSGGTTAFFDVDTGYVGINSTSPTFSLDVKAGAGDTLAARFDDHVYSPNFVGAGATIGILSVTGTGANINGGNLFVNNGGLQVSGVTTILGSLNANNTLDSTGIHTGSLATLGGLAVVKSANIGGNLSVGGTGNTKITGGNLFVTNGGLQVSGITTILGSLNANNTLESTGIHTGALATLGGLAVVKSANIGGTLSVSGITTTGGDLIATLGTVKISSGVVTATSGIVTYFGDGSNLTGFPEGSVGVSSGGTLIGAGATIIDFATVNATVQVSSTVSGISTVTIQPSVSLGLVIALGA